jgi:hypothetical protein
MVNKCTHFFYFSDLILSTIIKQRMSKEDFGVCFLGMGDCGSKIVQITETFNTNINETVKNTFINKNTTNNFMTGTTQTFRIKGLSCGGNLNISNISQKAVVSINFDSLDSSVDESTFNNMMTNAVAAVVDRNNEIKQEFMSAGADITTTTKTINENITRVATNNVYNDFKSTIMKLKADQDIGIIDVTVLGTCDINNISQTIQMDIVVKTISDRITKNLTDLMQDNKTKLDEKNKNKIESTGFFGDLGRALSGLVDSFTGPFKWIAILIGVAVIVSMLGIAIWRIVAAAKGQAAVGKPQGMEGMIRATGLAAAQIKSTSSGPSTGVRPRSLTLPTGSRPRASGMLAKGTAALGRKGGDSGLDMYGGWGNLSEA